MALRFRLKPVGSPIFKKIVCGGETVGRVCRAEVGYYAFIGPISARATTEADAFKEVCRKHGKPTRAGLPRERRMSIGPAPKPEPMRELNVTAVFEPPTKEDE